MLLTNNNMLEEKAFIGAPVSVTHVVVGSVMGVGAADELKMVPWGEQRRLFQVEQLYRDGMVELFKVKK